MRSLGLYALLLVVVTSIAIAYYLVEPAPPKDLRIAAGARTGAYYPIAKQLAERMRRHGVRVDIIETHGAAENLSLMTGISPPELALIQGGTHAPSGRDTSPLRTLASVDLEPVWLLARPGNSIASLRDFSKLRVAAGEQGSGTIDLFQTLTEVAGQTVTQPPLMLSNMDAVEAFRDRRADFIFSVSPAKNPWLETLIDNNEVQFVELEETDALTRKFGFLTTLKLPRASLDLKRSIPKRHVTLLATATNLVSRSEVHSATKMLALQALREIDHGTLLLGTDGQFPSLRFADYPIDAEARRFFSAGPPLIRRYLPYWVANLIERFYALLLPLITVALPLFRMIPAWLKRRRREVTQRWYGRLSKAEEAIIASSDNEEELQRHGRQLDRLERDLEQDRQHIPQPNEYFSLRFHIERIRRQLWRKQISGWLQTSERLTIEEGSDPSALNLNSYGALLNEIESDLRLLVDLEARFKQSGLPGELLGDVIDVKRGLRKARERVLSFGGPHREQPTENATPSSGARLSPEITLVSDRSGSSSKPLSADNED